MTEKLKKSDQTKARLLESMWELILEGDKVISVKTITTKAGTAYGSFYRYYKNLDQVHKELIQHRASLLAEFAVAELVKIESPLLSFYVCYYFDIGMFQQENVTQWLSKHPNFMNATWSEVTEATGHAILQEALESDEVPEFTQKNLDHYLRIRRYVFWTYQQIIRELSEGKPLQEIYLEFIMAVNLLDLPKDLHHQLANEAVSLASDFNFEN
jgi:AcrR family transcriptional regulator